MAAAAAAAVSTNRFVSGGAAAWHRMNGGGGVAALALSTDGEVEAGEAEEAELAQQPLVAVSRRGEERTVAGAGAGGGGGGANRGRGGAAAASAGGRLVARLGRPLAALQHRVAQQARQRHRQQRQAAPPQPPAKIFSVNEKYFKNSFYYPWTLRRLSITGNQLHDIFVPYFMEDIFGKHKHSLSFKTSSIHSCSRSGPGLARAG